MPHVLHQKTNTTIAKTLADGWEPTNISLVPGDNTIINFSNGKSASSSCLHCYDPPCMYLTESETVPSNFEGFPADQNHNVCAADAISRNENVGAPTIEEKLCIYCGVCASRCPVGAIRFDHKQGPIVDDESNEAFISIESLSIDDHITIRSKFGLLTADGSHIVENDEIVDILVSRLQEAENRSGVNFPNLLSRNLLIGAGIHASISRKGNVHMRMDMIMSPPGVNFGIAEVEFGQEASLDAPRDVMDALAVMVSRYKWPKDSTIAVVISDMLPNKRSEYWSIIQDIANVLEVRIGSITIFALMLCNWNRLKLNFEKGHEFYADRDMESYRASILEPLIGRKLHLGFRPLPQIDIAK